MIVASPVPRLLVSVRDAHEALQAAEGGADVIDFKNPDSGSLGRLDADAMRSAIERLTHHDSPRRPQLNLPLSAAMGEAVEAAQSLPERLPAGLSYLKLGLSGLRDSTDWVSDWLRARSLCEQQAAGRIQWVAVAYADAQAANAPPVPVVVRAAIETGCAGVLIDTFGKANGRLLDHADVPSLIQVAREVRRHRLFFALAGRLQVSDLSMLGTVAPDVVAVRSAACDNGDRKAQVTTANVQRLRQAMLAAFDGESRSA